MPKRHCIEPGCPNLTDHARCPAHQRAHEREAKRSTGRRGSTASWRKLRAKIIERDDFRCRWCGSRDPSLEVDHVDSDPMNDNEWNLQTLCSACHDRKTERDRKGSTPFVLLVGRSGVGKTAVRSELARQLRCESLGPDDFDGDWPTLISRLRAAEFAVVECVRVHSQLRPLLDHAYVVHLTAPQATRAKRLRETGLDNKTVVERVTREWSIGYGSPVKVDLELETDQATPEQLAARIRDKETADPPARLAHVE